MTEVEIFIDPSCPWAWVTWGWLKEVAAQRDLAVSWRPYCLEIRDDYGAAPWVPDEARPRVIAAHAVSHRMLRVLEAVRLKEGPESAERLYEEWGRRVFNERGAAGEGLIQDCLEATGLDAGLAAAGADERWDAPIVEAMEVAYAFGGPKTQTPTIVIRSDPPRGFKGPVMSPAPSGDAALRLWDAIRVLADEPGFFEMTRPRVNQPYPSRN